jgi:hypothetical protein
MWRQAIRKEREAAKKRKIKRWKKGEMKTTRS